jgi:NADPH:quinone reductase
MKAVVYRGAGGPEVVATEERPAPELGADEVLIRVAGAGVNRPDIIPRNGFYPPPQASPTSRGWRCRERWRRWGLE